KKELSILFLICFIFIFLLMANAQEVITSKVYMKDGTTYIGEIQKYEDSLIFLKTNLGVLSIPEEEIKFIIVAGEEPRETYPEPCIILTDGTIIPGKISKYSNKFPKNIEINSKYGRLKIEDFKKIALIILEPIIITGAFPKYKGEFKIETQNFVFELIECKREKQDLFISILICNKDKEDRELGILACISTPGEYIGSKWESISKDRKNNLIYKNAFPGTMTRIIDNLGNVYGPDNILIGNIGISIEHIYYKDEWRYRIISSSILPSETPVKAIFSFKDIPEELKVITLFEIICIGKDGEFKVQFRNIYI
ncbi:MAG: hypothetical protein QXI58_06470, partial [Candidatus Micrarchaeia archaeon]